MMGGTSDTAPRIGSGRIAVLATPKMINLIEEAALAAIGHLLPDGKQSLGTQIDRSEEHTSELQSLMRISYAVFCLKKKKKQTTKKHTRTEDKKNHMNT